VSEPPFRIGTHVTDAFFTDRAPEVQRVLRAMREPTRLLVFGPRRMGKSSVIAVASEGARRHDVLVVRADLSTASSLIDVGNRLLHSLSRQRERGWLAELAAGLAPSVVLTFDAETGAPRIVFGAERRSAAHDEQRRSLDQVIEALAKETAEGASVAVVLDEFQAIRRFGGEEAEWHLRDLMQRHGDVSFVCAGSEISLVEEMLGRERAFFRTFELLHLGPIPTEHLARWIDSRMEAAGVTPKEVGRELVERVGPRTQDILQVARHVFRARRSRGRADASDVEAGIREVVQEEAPIIHTIWSDLTRNQQNVLRAVAAGVDQLFSTRVRRRFGLPASSTVSVAVDALEKRGILVRVGEDRTIRFDSPFVRRWVAWETLDDVPDTAI